MLKGRVTFGGQEPVWRSPIVLSYIVSPFPKAFVEGPDWNLLETPWQVSLSPPLVLHMVGTFHSRMGSHWNSNWLP